MADTTKKRKRVVKNPETFRERAIKAAEGESKPKVHHKAKRGIAKVLAPVFKPIGKLLKFIFYRQPFKFIGKILVPPYVRNSWKEIRLVTWPTWTQSRKLTFAVLIFALFFGAAIAGLDWVLEKLFREVLLK